jgi:ABC-2 type transport system permease protein
MSLLFLFGALSFGMLLSIVTKNQLLASQMAIITTVLPAFLLSGFIFPLENMPLPIQWFTHIITARYFVFILRGIYLKDVGMTVLWPEALFFTAVRGDRDDRCGKEIQKANFIAVNPLSGTRASGP